MNTLLTEQIVKHILSSLKVIFADFIDAKSQTLISRKFLLNDKLQLQVEDDELIQNNVWGCKFHIEGKELKIIVGDASIDNSVREFCAIIHLDDSPTYGMYIIMDEDSKPLIACSMNGKDWMTCSTYLEATFLAGMEQMKSHLLLPQNCENYKSEFESMISLLDFHSTVFGAINEGEES
jgi:hypothetical protein